MTPARCLVPEGSLWQEEPDQHFLDMIGMTKEEYLQRDIELKAAAEAEDSALIPMEEVEEEAEDWGRAELVKWCQGESVLPSILCPDLHAHGA